MRWANYVAPSPTKSRFDGFDRRSFLTGLVAGMLAHGVWADVPNTLADLDLLGLDGGPSRLSGWRAPILVNVWATWCGPCREEMPALQALAVRTAPLGIPVAALSFDTDLNLVREFVLRHGLTLPVALARDARRAGTALGVTAVPTTLLLDAQGRVIQRYVGPRDWAAPDWPARIAGALAASAAGAD